jgi:25S rRNA (uracil2634-N3)-methyltransferase
VEQNIRAILDSSKKPKATETDPEAENNTEEKSTLAQKAPKVLFSVDARKLGSPGGGAKEIRTGFLRHERKRPGWFQPKSPDPPYQPGGPWDVICFNFPHVGGLSTDVNRQVRANQELLVAFFKACVPLVSKAPPLMDADEDEWEVSESEEEEDDDEDDEEEGGDETTGKGFRTGPGQILVTLFEAEPYTLWNIKDLARHAGLIVVTSFRFPWASYEGYSHARTIGEIEGKNGERGGWRGEDRDARMYVFEVKEKPKWKQKPKFNKKTQKREREDSSSDSD